MEVRSPIHRDRPLDVWGMDEWKNARPNGDSDATIVKAIVEPTLGLGTVFTLLCHGWQRNYPGGIRMAKMLVEVLEDRIGSHVAGLVVDNGLETIDDVLEACNQGELQEINGIGSKRAAKVEAYAARAKIRSVLEALPAGYASAWTVAAQEALSEAEEVLDESPEVALIALGEGLKALEEDEKALGVKQEGVDSAVESAESEVEETEAVERCPRCGWDGNGEPERAIEWKVTLPETEKSMQVCRKCAQSMVQLSGYVCEGLDLHLCACGEPVDRLAESGMARKLGHLAGTCQLCKAKSLAKEGADVTYKQDVPARVIWFDGDEKPYGFLSCVGIRDQVFVHENQVCTDLVAGQKVHAGRVVVTLQGLQAQDVRTVRMSGTVKWFDHSKNYGWIATDEEDLFVHASQVSGASLWRGDKVEFGLAQSEKGW